MDEHIIEALLAPLLKEMGLFILAIWATTWRVGNLRILRPVDNQLIALIIGFIYGFAAWAGHLLDGGFIVVFFIKAPIAGVAAQLFHDRIFTKFTKSAPEAVTSISDTMKMRVPRDLP